MPLAGTYTESLRFPMPVPTITRIATDDGVIWEVSGLGMTIKHRQLWQAELIWICMCTSKGFSVDQAPPSDQ